MENDRQTTELIQNAILRMEENTERIEKCLRELTEEETWRRPNEASNSVGNLILHLCGNIRQWAIASLGRRPDTRKRDAEFAAREGFSKGELLTRLSQTVTEAMAVMKSLDEEELLRIRRVQAYDISGIGVIMHVVEHYSYHTGQVAFWTKLLRDKDLGFYTGVGLG